MKKYLMRGGISPLKPATPEYILEHKALGANSGNLLYALGVYRTLLTEDTTIDMDLYRVEKGITEEEIQRINNEYDAYICPLADAFRDAFAGKLKKYAAFFRKLQIPVYVIGLGVRTPYDSDVTQGFGFDKEAREFVRAVREKGTILGLRGETTGSYLKHLGFLEGTDYRVIGCPSLYTFGRELPQRPLTLNEDGSVPADVKIAFNMSNRTPEPILNFLLKELNRFEDHYCVEQSEAELCMLYTGITQKKKKKTALPTDTSHPLLVENRYKFFIHPKPWFRFMQGMDLCVGSKLHGNVAGVLGGCPVLFIVLDGRMRELAKFHDLPAIPFHEVGEQDTLETLMSQVDLQSHLKKQPENFDNFLRFLDDNGLDHIYKTDKNRKDAPLDKLLEEVEAPEITSILTCSMPEAIRRFNIYVEILNKQSLGSKDLKKIVPGPLQGIARRIFDKMKR